MLPNDLGLYERYTLRRYLPAVVAEGIVFALLGGLGDIVLAKGLKASPGYVTALAMMFPASLLFAVVAGGLMKGRAKGPYLLAAGLLGRGPLLLMPLVESPLAFVALMFCAASATSVIVPAQTTIVQANYAPERRARLFALAQAAATLAGIAAALLCGLWLDKDERAYRVIFPVAGVLGVAAPVLYGRIKLRRARRRFGTRGAAAPGLGGAVGEAIASVTDGLRLLREEPRFRRFETGFFLYGAAFMCLQPIIPVYLVSTLHADYAEASIAKSGVFGLASTLMLAPFGRLVDRIGPARGGVRFFGILALFPLALAAASTMPQAYPAFAIYGTAMAGVNILWSLGSIHFARGRESGPFQGVHVALVGVRGLLAPLLGYAALALGRPRLGMALASGLLLCAVLVMARLARDEAREPWTPVPGA
jgi:MFS family permease